MTIRRPSLVGLLLAAGLLAACSDRQGPAAPTAQALAPRADAVHFAPSPLTPVSLPGRAIDAWPYTADQLPATPVDPINLVFVGPYADPRSIRAALLGTGGDRSAIGLAPGLMPGVFDCHWTDGLGGGNQAAFVDGNGWMGSVIQLTCGPYNVFRFHLRLFPFGNITLAGAHFEMNIPGTADHESLSWEVARGVVAYDLAAAGRLAAAPGAVYMGSQTPTFRSVRDAIYNASPALQFLLSQFGSTYPAIPNDGGAVVLQLAPPPAVTPGSSTVTLDLDYDVDMPKPFCNPGDFLHVAGPVQLRQTTTVTPSGDYSATWEARALVNVTPLVGSVAPFQAKIHEVEASVFTDQVAQVTSRISQRMTPPAPGLGFQVKWLRVGPGAAANFQNQVHCYGS